MYIWKKRGCCTRPSVLSGAGAALGAGAATEDIIEQYVLTIRALLAVDGSGVLLEAVSGAIRAYLRQRKVSAPPPSGPSLGQTCRCRGLSECSPHIRTQLLSSRSVCPVTHMAFAIAAAVQGALAVGHRGGGGGRMEVARRAAARRGCRTRCGAS